MAEALVGQATGVLSRQSTAASLADYRKSPVARQSRAQSPGPVPGAGASTPGRPGDSIGARPFPPTGSVSLTLDEEIGAVAVQSEPPSVASSVNGEGSDGGVHDFGLGQPAAEAFGGGAGSAGGSPSRPAGLKQGSSGDATTRTSVQPVSMADLNEESDS